MSGEISVENLLARGYVEHCAPSGFNHATRFFQRRVRDESGKTLYFIDQYYYEHAELPSIWETESQMERDGLVVNVKTFNNISLDKAEQMIADIFGLGMKAYDK